MTRTALPLVCFSLLWGGSGLAQELPYGQIYGQPNGFPILDQLGIRPTRLIVVVTRYCRAGVCVRLTEYREVDDTEEQQDSEAGLPAQRRSSRRHAPQPTYPANEVSPTDENLPPQATPAPSCGNREETDAWRLLNAHRSQLGLNTLSCDLTALKVARAHSADMCARGYFSHYSPEGSAPWDRLRRSGARFRSAGENIAMGYDTAGSAHQGWLDSPGHRQNIERVGWVRAAVGLVSCEHNGAKYWTELFSR